MFKNFYMIVKRCLIFGLVLVFGVPLSVMLTLPGKASAAEKTTVPVVESSKTASLGSKVVLKKEDVLAPILLGIDGLPDDNIYWQGQKIDWQITFNESDLTVWAEVANIDSSFPEIIYANQLVDRIWRLQTPRFSGELIPGGHVIKIVAHDKAGNITRKNIKIALRKLPSVGVVDYKLLGQDKMFINWQPIAGVDFYLVEWNIQDEETTNYKVVDSKFSFCKIEDLEPGTIYNIKVSPVIQGEKAKGSEISVKTLGTAPIKTVAGQEIQVFEQAVPEKKITPSIDEGASISRKIAQTEPQVAPEAPKEEKEEVVTPTPSPSPSEEEETEAGGWSKILVALSILIIAAGAAIGGYYGYEWLMLKSKDKDKEPPESGNRW